MSIDLSRLPAPKVVEALDYETILAAMVADLQGRDSSFTAIVESDPAYKVLETAAYRELLLRQRVNDAAKAVMLAFAGGSDEDQLGALLNVERLVIDPEDPGAVPPVAATYESDDAFRDRIQLAPEGFSVAGPSGAYEYFARSASGKVADVKVTRPADGEVLVSVLSGDGDGTPDQDTLDAVTAALTDKSVRPLTDKVTVAAAEIVDYSITAVLTLYDGPDSDVVRQAAEDAAVAYAAAHHRIGHDITLAGLYAALAQAGVMDVDLSAPAASVVISDSQASWCTAVSVTVGGTGE